MAGSRSGGRRVGGSRWRVAGWSLGAALVLLPLAAMQFTEEVDWGPEDFAVAGGLVLAVGILGELAVRRGGAAYRAGAAVALAAGFLLVWVNAAVGIIGSENNPANLVFFGVLALGLVGAALARFRPKGMAVAMAAAGMAQIMAPLIAVAAGLGDVERPWVPLVGSVIFAALWLLSAWLFRRAARGETDSGVRGGRRK